MPYVSPLTDEYLHAFERHSTETTPERGAFAAGLLAADNGDGYTELSGGHGTSADSFPQ